MARITLDGIAHSYDARLPNVALKRLDHVWQHGRAYALLGPSGCGKTTLLNIISGLITPSEGRVLFDEKDVTQLPTEQRNIAQVFQFPVIYDTMSVAENLAFPLKNRGMDRRAIKVRVAESPICLASARICPVGRETSRLKPNRGSRSGEVWYVPMLPQFCSMNR